MTTENKHERTNASFRGAAMDYVEAQLNVMRKYGSNPILSPEQYYKLVAKIEAVGKELWLASGGTIKP
jgi:hypothetical protein